MNEINLNLTIDETNATLMGLTKLPYEVSANIINKIQQQAAPQVTPTAEVTEGAVSDPQLLTE